VIPTNPVTDAQTTQRANFASISSNYRDLTVAQQAAWIAFGQNFARTDTLGETYDLQGNQAFLSVNRNLFIYGGAPLSSPPLYAPPSSPAGITVTAVGG
jgi:hypothetical protein